MRLITTKFLSCHLVYFLSIRGTSDSTQSLQRPSEFLRTGAVAQVPQIQADQLLHLRPKSNDFGGHRVDQIFIGFTNLGRYCPSNDVRISWLLRTVPQHSREQHELPAAGHSLV